MSKLTKRLSERDKLISKRDKLIKKCASVLAENTCVFVHPLKYPSAFLDDCKRMEEKIRRWNPSDRVLKRYIKWRKYCADFEWGKISNVKAD